ncbi:MAG: TIGR03663 family protein [Verrucomicrobiales bacterium]|nr:TIGR03663 family protein [Verrucomicrobiales bacterium]
MKRWGVAGLLLLVITAALFLRCGDLAGRPLHNDEAINAFKVRKLWATGEFRYDPHEYHGPVLYYLTLPVAAVAKGVGGAVELDERTMRSVPLVVGIALILLLALAADGLGWGVVAVGGLFTAVSPVMVYYSRYYIHELPLVFFTAWTLLSAWRYSRRPGPGWAAAVGAGVALMYATKETFVFALASAVGAWGVAQWISLRELALTAGRSANLPSRGGGAAAWTAGLVHPWWEAVRRHGWSAGLAGAVVFVLLFTSFFTNAAGPLDALRTYWIWGERAGGASPHIHPWAFYFQRLAWFRWRSGPLWTEAAVLGWALIGVWGVAGRGWLGGKARFLGLFVAVYSVLLAAVYALIPYKTPWCALGFYHGLLVLAGYGVGFLWHRFRATLARALLGCAVLVSAGHLAVQSTRATGEYAADFRNPWVYGHTSADIWNLLEQLEAVAAVHPEGRRMAVQIMAPESGYWPLPWYLRTWERVGWWDKVPEEPLAPLVVTAARLDARLEEKTGKAWRMVGMFELRPRFFVEVNVEAGLWQVFLAARARENASAGN